MIDPAKFHDAFFKWTSAIAGEIKGVVAIGGKTARRSREKSKEKRPLPVVSAWAYETSLVLGQMKVDEKTNEIKAIPKLLEMLCLKGCIVTIDAITHYRLGRLLAQYIKLWIVYHGGAEVGKMGNGFDRGISVQDAAGIFT